MNDDYQPPIPQRPPGNIGVPIGSDAPTKIQFDSPGNFLYKIAQKVRADPALKRQLERRVYEMLREDLRISRDRY
jgi:hypothetical protein